MSLHLLVRCTMHSSLHQSVRASCRYDRYVVPSRWRFRRTALWSRRRGAAADSYRRLWSLAMNVSVYTVSRAVMQSITRTVLRSLYVPRNKRRRATPRWTSAPRTATAWDDAQRLSCAAHEHTSLSLLLLRPPACCLDSEAERCQYSKSQRTRRRKRAPRRLPAPISAQKRLSLRVRLLPRPQEQGILRITPSATMGLVQIPEFLELSLRVLLRTLLLLPPLRRTPSRTTPTPTTRPQRSRRDLRRN